MSDAFLGVGFHLGAPCSAPLIFGSTGNSGGSEVVSNSGFLTSSSPAG